MYQSAEEEVLNKESVK